MQITRKTLIEDEKIKDFILDAGVKNIAKASGVSTGYIYAVLANKVAMSEKVYDRILKYRDEQTGKL